jgi:hypothetical protein
MEEPVNYIVKKVDPTYFEKAGIQYVEPPLMEGHEKPAEHAELKAIEAAR